MTQLENRGRRFSDTFTSLFQCQTMLPLHLTVYLHAVYLDNTSVKYRTGLKVHLHSPSCRWKVSFIVHRTVPELDSNTELQHSAKQLK